MNKIVINNLADVKKAILEHKQQAELGLQCVIGLSNLCLELIKIIEQSPSQSSVPPRSGSGG